MNFHSIKSLLGGNFQHRTIITFPATLLGAAVMSVSLVACSGFGSGPVLAVKAQIGPGTLSCGLLPPATRLLLGCGYKINFRWEGALSNAAVNQIAASDFSLVFTSHNVSVNNGTYSAVVSLYDQNHNLIAAHDVSVYITGNTVHLSNPDALAAWVEAHDAQARSMKAAIINNIAITLTTTQGGTGKVTATQQVNGVQGGSSTSVFQIPSGGGGGSGCISGQPCHHPVKPFTTQKD